MAGSGERRAPRFVFLTAATGGAPRFGWRLDAANHRPLAKSTVVETSLAACQVAARRLHDEIDSAAPDVLLERAGSAWVWRLDPVSATCLHAYARRVECLRAFAHFRNAAVAADPADGVVRDFGPHSLRNFIGSLPTARARR